MAEHFTPEVFAKSQAYGKDKAKFSFVTGLYKQTVDSLMLHYGAYPWAWDVAGRLIGKLGYSTEYEVRRILLVRIHMLTYFTDSPIHCVLLCRVLHFIHPYPPLFRILHIRIGGEAWVQQDNAVPLYHGFTQRLGYRFRHRRAVPGCVPLRLQVGRRSFRSLAHGLLVSISVPF